MQRGVRRRLTAIEYPTKVAGRRLGPGRADPGRHADSRRSDLGPPPASPLAAKRHGQLEPDGRARRSTPDRALCCATGATAERLFRESIDHLGDIGSVLISPAPTCSTANGCAARVGGSTPARSFASLADTSSARSACRRSLNGPVTELLATGETVRKRTVETRDDLTAQERQIAQLARDGPVEP